MNCLSELQFGFRSKHSTSHALISITEKIREAIDSGKFSCGIFIDLQKAFDTVDHSILVSKLEYYGVRGLAKDWFFSYLDNRKQFVSINGFESSHRNIKSGVPQGSVLGPLLFLIYINDLAFSVKHSTVHHFADDTNLLCINKSLKTLYKNMNYDLRGITDWLNGNKISLNASKTEFVIFRKPGQSLHLEFKIKLNGKRLYPSNYIKYLGILIDENLSWKPHTLELTKKLSRANSMLSKIRYYVDKSTLRTIYYSIFFSHLHYCCQVWGQHGNSYINKLQSLQRSSLRIMNFLPFRSNVDNLYKDMNILNFIDMIKIHNITFVHNSLISNLPSAISNFFQQCRDMYQYDLRYNVHGKLNVPKFKSTKYGKYSIKYQCIYQWNKSLPTLISQLEMKYKDNQNINSLLDLNTNYSTI